MITPIRTRLAPLRRHRTRFLLTAGLALLGSGATTHRHPDFDSTATPPAAPVARWLTPFYREGTYRWLDIADRPYSVTFRRLFRYTDRQVLVKYTRTDGETLRGELVAHGLKPNFAYQLKLEGQPTKPVPLTAADLNDPRNWTNKQLAAVGRQWCVECATNVGGWATDTDVHEGHRVLGYLLFDFFVTDENGSARHEFAVAGSYHVLWRIAQYPPGAQDGSPRRYHPVARVADGYARDAPPATVTLYLEHEYDRPAPGKLRLPAGVYKCRLLLTEESFHSYGSPNEENAGGHWCHCLSDEKLRFTIRPPEAADPGKEATP